MKLIVTTVYDGVNEETAKRLADFCFDGTVADQNFPPETLEEMKQDLLRGETVGAAQHCEHTGMTVESSWRLIGVKTLPVGEVRQ